MTNLQIDDMVTFNFIRSLSGELNIISGLGVIKEVNERVCLVEVISINDPRLGGLYKFLTLGHYWVKFFSRPLPTIRTETYLTDRRLELEL